MPCRGPPPRVDFGARSRGEDIRPAKTFITPALFSRPLPPDGERQVSRPAGRRRSQGTGRICLAFLPLLPGWGRALGGEGRGGEGSLRSARPSPPYTPSSRPSPR